MHRQRLVGIVALAALAASQAARAGDVAVTILDGGLQRPGGVAGAAVAIEDTALSATTDGYGRATVASVPTGRRVLRITGPAGFTPVRLVIDVPASGTLTVLPLLLPRVPAGTPVSVPTSSGVVTTTTQVESS